MSGSLQRAVYDLLVIHSTFGLSTSEISAKTKKSYTEIRRVLPTVISAYAYEWRRTPNHLKIRDIVPWEPVWKVAEVPKHEFPPSDLRLHTAYHMNFAGHRELREIIYG